MKNIYNKNALTILIFVMLTCSCSESFLDQEPTSTLTDSTYYKIISELETGLVACYGALRNAGNFEMYLWEIGDIGSDDADKGSTDGDQPWLIDISYSRQIPTNYSVEQLWSNCYMVISTCNQVLDKSIATTGDPVKIERIVDQARFLRALSYYHLVTAFGDVPLVTRFLVPSELNLKRNSATEIWAQIESDLIEATNLWTRSEWNAQGNQSGRISSGAVYSLLGKVYLTQKKYDLANAAFSKVVNSGQYTLVSDYGSIFRKAGENCAESVFEIQHKNNISGGNMGTWTAAARIPRDYDANGWGFDCPTSDLLIEFEPGDPRTIYTYMFKGDKFPGANTGAIYTVANVYSPTGYNSRKAWIPFSERAGLSQGDWEMNYRYMRYAEVLLLYAESLNEVNKPDSALLLLNMVRTRARNTPPTDPQRISCAFKLSYTGQLLPDITTRDQSMLRQAIWHEQRVELAIEGHRRNTLLRTDRFKGRMETAKGNRGCTVEPHESLLPVPQYEIDVSNMLISQNPGY